MKRSPEQLLNLAWSSRNFNAVYALVLFALLLLPLSRFAPEVRIVSLLLILSAPAVCRLRWKSRKKCAAELDRLAHAHSVLEAWLELPESHPLKSRLYGQAEQAYRSFRAPLWMFLHAWLIPLILMVSLVVIQLLRGKTVPPRAEKTEAAAPVPEKKEAEREELAELVLTQPDADLRAKPLDELEWEGAGLSARGFRSIVLEVAVNGKKRKEFAPDSLPEQKGTIRFQGFLALEELDVEPFELVSCHLAGQAVTANGTRPVLSTPCFIEVRPFREDVLTPDQIPDFANKRKMFEAHASITLILENQLELNKLLFTTKILLARGSMKEHENAYSELRSGQISLAKELDVLLGDPESRFMPADAVNHLESAYSAMRNAVELLEKKDLDRASAAQQTAIAELIQSLKSTKKVLLPRGSGNESNQPEPFRDDQEFKVPPMPDSENPDRKLAELVKRQEELLRKMKEVQSDPQELAERQNVLRKDAVQLAPRAAGAMAESEGMLKSGKLSHAAIAAQKALSELRQARRELGRRADESMKTALRKAQAKLRGNQEKTTLGELARDLLREAMKQHKSGKQEYAKSLLRTAEKADRGAKAKTPEAFAEELANELETLRLLGRSPSEILQSGILKLDELSKRLKFAARHPDPANPEELPSLKEECRAELDDVRVALEQLLRSNGRDRMTESVLAEAKRILNSNAFPESHRDAAGRAAMRLSEELSGFVRELRKAVARVQISANVYIFNPDDVPERYRRDVGEYFKRLSEKQQEEKP